MQKPQAYEETKENGVFTPVNLGGHKIVVKQVSEKKNKNGGDMIVVLFDFAPEDAQPGYFMEQFKNDIRPDKKWPNQATQYINVNDNEGKCSRDFKTFCTCVEHSNAGFSAWKPDNSFNFEGFKGKKIGGVFGEQMDYYNGRELNKRVLRWFVSVDKVADAQIPAISETRAYKDWKEHGGQQNASIAASDGFMSIPDTGLDELPFN
jgi:hypothetical protein